MATPTAVPAPSPKFSTVASDHDDADDEHDVDGLMPRMIMVMSFQTFREEKDPIGFGIQDGLLSPGELHFASDRKDIFHHQEKVGTLSLSSLLFQVGATPLQNTSKDEQSTLSVQAAIVATV